MILSIEIAEQRAERILRALSANKRNQQMAVELTEIINYLLQEISQREMDNAEIEFMYNDLRTGTIEMIRYNNHRAAMLNKLLKGLVN